MMGIVELAQLGILTVHRQCVLSQVIGTHREEVCLLSQLLRLNSCCGCLYHDSDGHILNGMTFVSQFLGKLLTELSGSADLPDRSDHGEHNAEVAVCTGPQNGAQLRPEDFILTGQADSQASQAQRRIFFLLQSHVGHLLISSNVQGTHNNRTVAHNLANLLICLKQLVLGRQGIPAQIEELTAHQAYAFTVRCHCRLGILRTADVCTQQNLLAGLADRLFASVNLQRLAVCCGFVPLLCQHLHGLFIRICIPDTGKAVHSQNLAVICIGKLNIRLNQRGNVQSTGQNGCMAAGRTLSGHKSQNLISGQLNRLAGAG